MRLNKSCSERTQAWLSVDKRVIDFSEVGQLETARESDLIDYNIYQPAYRLGGVAWSCEFTYRCKPWPRVCIIFLMVK